MADWQMQVSYTLNSVGEAATNVLNFIDIGGDNDEAAATGIAELWQDAMENVISTACAVEPRTRFIWPLVDPTDELIADNDGITGTVTGELYAASCAYRVNTSGGIGARRRGHIFIPGVSESEVGAGGVVNPIHAAGISVAVASFIEGVALTHGFLLGVFSRVGGTISGVNGLSTSTVVRQQRRRIRAFASE